jgi:hypothetical protein
MGKVGSYDLAHGLTGSEEITIKQRAGTRRAAIKDLKVTATGGTTARTLAEWFAGLGVSGDEPPVVGFWPDFDPGAVVHRFRDRVFIGAAVERTSKFSAPTGSVRSWLGVQGADSSHYLDWVERDSTLLAVSENSGIAVTGAARTSDAQVVGTNGFGRYSIGEAIGLTGIGVADEAAAIDFNGNPLKAWGAYLEAHKTVANAGSTLGIEVEINNLAAAATYENPYTTTAHGATLGVWVGSGGGQPRASTYPASLALGIINNGDTFDAGIVIKSNAITLDENSLGLAIALAKGHKIQWTYSGSSAAIGGEVWSEATDAATSASVVFVNNGIVVRMGAVDLFHVLTAASLVNSFVFAASATGKPLIIRPGASGDSNIPIVLRGKGASSAAIQGSDGVNRVAANSTGLGFFNTAPVARPTGVAVTAEGIHAALVTLGLIAA